MATKTIVITLPRPLKPVSTQMVPAANNFTQLLDNDLLRVVKQEPDDRVGEKPPRKRQKLDHLTQEEKVMRRKLKNRVAAQTARDRKKLRMDQMESQLSDMTEHVAELTNLVNILTNKNTELQEQNDALQEKLGQCTCLGRVETKEECQSMTNSKEPQESRVEGVMVPVTMLTDGSAEGSQHIGSNQDHGSLYTVLPVGNTSSHGSGVEQCITSNADRQGHLQSKTPRPSVTSKETSVRQVVGTTATVLEPNWDVDHDYSSGVHNTQDLNERLTPAEEFITQLTSVLDSVPNSTQNTNVSTTGVQNFETVDDLSTSDIFEDFFDFQIDSGIFKESSVTSEEAPYSVPSNETTKPFEDSPRIASPISGEHIQDMVAITSPQSVFGSDSGYESGSSPTYLASDDEQKVCFDLSSFSELFPSLL